MAARRGSNPRELAGLAPTSGDLLRLKGQKAERAIHDLAEKTFLVDWCYPNPQRPGGKELCDLLVVFDDTALIWQIKDLKLDGEGRYKPKEVEKNLRQLAGARRTLFELPGPIHLSNPRRDTESFDPSPISRVFLISVLMGEGEEYYPFLQAYKHHTVHVLTRDFAPLLMSELDTVSDFVRYFTAKEALLEDGQRVQLVGGEEELLAYFILHERSFKGLENHDLIMIDQGCWEEVQKLPAYMRKKKADEMSYVWDSIIERAHEGSAEYERVARELARPDRFQRRVLSKCFFESQVRAHESDPSKVYRHLTEAGGVTYCFIFLDDPEPRTRRKEMLQAMCYIARGKMRQNTKVLGVATERTLAPTCSYDFCFLDFPTWNDQCQKHADELQDATGILSNVEERRISEDEFPESGADIEE